MFVPILVVHILVSITLILIVLLQAGRGADLGAAFGSVGQATFARGGATFLSKFTTAMAVIFMSTSLSLAFISSETPTQSILAPVSGQANPIQNPIPAEEEIEQQPPPLESTEAPPMRSPQPPLEPTDAPPQQ